MLLDDNKNNLSKPVPHGGSASLQVHYATPETHMSYALTWFSLTIVSLIIPYFKFRISPSNIIKRKNLIK